MSGSEPRRRKPNQDGAIRRSKRPCLLIKTFCRQAGLKSHTSAPVGDAHARRIETSCRIKGYERLLMVVERAFEQALPLVQRGTGASSQRSGKERKRFLFLAFAQSMVGKVCKQIRVRGVRRHGTCC
jgi:hypothetical protein